MRSRATLGHHRVDDDHTININTATPPQHRDFASTYYPASPVTYPASPIMRRAFLVRDRLAREMTLHR